MNKIIIEVGEYRGVWGSLTEICEVYKLPYHSIKDKPFPIHIEGYVIRKVKYRDKGKLVCKHPYNKKASFKSHGKDFCWECGEHIEIRN